VQALPNLDIGPFRADPLGAAGRDFVKRLRDACHGPGFCYLSGHGVPEALDAGIMAAARAFFTLPETDRRAIAIANSRHFRGYTVLGDERTRGVSDWRDQLDVGPEEPAESVARDDPPWRRLRGPNQWPASLPRMQPVVLEWMQAMDRLGIAVMRALALGLGQAIDYFDAAIAPRGDAHLKIVRYPAQLPDRDTGQGVGLHHDSGLLSFVLQDEVGGLQAQIGESFVDAAPRPNTYVMNLGEMLQAATGGYLRATKHRVQSPPPGRQRISIAYFFNPRLESTFTPIELPPELASEAAGGQSSDANDPIFATFGVNYLKIRLRSHPDVARAHYADVPRLSSTES
jgi:isopenicillin N synthase-like dioxygenase